MRKPGRAGTRAVAVALVHRAARAQTLDLTLERDDSGRWHVRGLPGQQAQADPLATLERLGELQVSHARLHVRAPALGIETRLPASTCACGWMASACARARMPGSGPATGPIAAAIDFDRGTGDGLGLRRPARCRPARVRRVAADRRVVPVARRGGCRPGWPAWPSHRRRACGATLEGVVLQGAPLVAGAPAPTRSLGAVSLDARWRGTLRQWQAQATRLRIGSGRTPDDARRTGGGRRRALRPARGAARSPNRCWQLGDAASPAAAVAGGIIGGAVSRRWPSAAYAAGR